MVEVEILLVVPLLVEARVVPITRMSQEVAELEEHRLLELELLVRQEVPVTFLLVLEAVAVVRPIPQELLAVLVALAENTEVAVAVVEVECPALEEQEVLVVPAW